MRVHLVVNQACIADGVQEDESRCPIALAVKAQVPGARHVVVDSYIEFVDDAASWRAPHTRESLAFLFAFDASEPVDPFEVDLTFQRRYDGE